jgi:hypothetical protein
MLLRKPERAARYEDNRLMHTDARTRIAAGQLELVRALVGNEFAPEGFDSLRIQAAADALLLKRAHSVARAWPELARSLGATFDERFARYARSRPMLQDGGPMLDGRRFAHSLARGGHLADDASVEVLAFDVRNSVKGDKVVARRSIWIGAVFLRQSLRLIIAIRLPLFGERWINLPLKFL